MNSSPNRKRDLLLEYSALQHERAPRPLPLFLELVRQVSTRDPRLASEALAGLRAYERAPRHERRPQPPEVARVRGAALRDYGGSGPPALLVPSLINPPRILDLDDEVSLTRAIAQMGRRTYLLDWGKASERAQLSVAEHVNELLLPLIKEIGSPVALVGYCLGGTMAVAAANLVEVECLITLASPWRFANYPKRSHDALRDMWRQSQSAARQLGALPMEVLQAAFWSLDPDRTVSKFAEFSELDPSSAASRRFVELEQWANEGEPLPYPAAQELVEELFGKDRPGTGTWMVGSRRVADYLSVPTLHLTAARDLIVPPQTAAAGHIEAIDAGHVGMIVGSARHRLHEALQAFLNPGCRC
ncbi:MAG TPA: alpha/beta fold hydrolase [Sphingomicrobium sp.]|nr:alpha/beta fold hydrolase [Sphingomicrobium sp.]